MNNAKATMPLVLDTFSAKLFMWKFTPNFETTLIQRDQDFGDPNCYQFNLGV